MARGLAIKHEDGSVECSAPWFNDRFATRLSSKPAGLYRVTMKTEARGSTFLCVGARCPGSTPAEAVKREALRLEKLGAETVRPAHTGAPGVVGFQHCETMSRYAQDSAKAATRALARWASDQARTLRLTELGISA